jgi:hypothetical protein
MFQLSAKSENPQKIEGLPHHKKNILICFSSLLFFAGIMERQFACPFFHRLEHHAV